jgi:FKBP-type peptidyl-prolyl cis-trans isomerase FklB
MATPAQQEGAAFLAEVDQRPNVFKTSSGLRFCIKAKPTNADAKSPKVDTASQVHYHGTFINGKVFDSSYTRGKPSSFAPNQVIPGWTEALQYMAEGEKWEVYLPHDIAYGARGAPGAIPPFSVLIFTIEIVKVNGGKSAAEAHALLETAIGKKYDEILVVA